MYFILFNLEVCVENICQSASHLMNLVAFFIVKNLIFNQLSKSCSDERKWNLKWAVMFRPLIMF